MRNRLPNRLKQAGVSFERYMALKWLCKEYDGMRAALAVMRRQTAPAPGGADAKRAEDAEKRIIQSREFQQVRAIEQAAIQTDAELYPAILTNACRGVSYETMRPKPPCGKNQFYERCVAFYENLHRLAG